MYWEYREVDCYQGLMKTESGWERGVAGGVLSLITTKCLIQSITNRFPNSSQQLTRLDTLSGEETG